MAYPAAQCAACLVQLIELALQCLGERGSLVEHEMILILADYATNRKYV
jgi:hypothetical protein